MSSGKKRLPIGIQTFEKMRNEHYYYVDKTSMILAMVQGGTHYFLSRPRRFGKSLLLDTIRELFEGHHSLQQPIYLIGVEFSKIERNIMSFEWEKV